MTNEEKITIDNSKQLKDFLIPIFAVLAFLISIHQYLGCVLFLFIVLTIYLYLLKDVSFTKDEIIINRKYFPFNKTKKFDYSILKKVAIIGGVYNSRMPTTLKISFKNISAIEYPFINEVQKEKILLFFIEKNILILDNNLAGVKEMLARLKANKN